jgi:hypothetical protein
MTFDNARATGTRPYPSGQSGKAFNGSRYNASTQGGPYEHYCACGAWGCFGVGVTRANPGKWYCGKCKPADFFDLRDRDAAMRRGEPLPEPVRFTEPITEKTITPKQGKLF